MHWAAIPRIRSRPVIRSVVFLVLQKTMTRSRCSRSRMAASRSTLPPMSTFSRYWLILGRFSWTGRTTISTGSRW